MDIVKAEFRENEDISVDKLFSGYDRLRAITYSSGIDFMAKVLEKFEDAEIVFGSPAVMSQKISTVMSFEQKVIEDLALPKNVKRFAKRREDGSLRFFVSRDMRSHEKLYLLESERHRRVIVGSANFSGSAFFGLQREVVIMFDDDDGAWEYYSKRYETYRDKCADTIEPEVIDAVVADASYLDDKPEEIPIVSERNVNVMVIQETEPGGYDEQVVYVADIKGKEAEIREYAPPTRKASGAVVIRAKAIEVMKANRIKFKDMLKRRRRVFPVMELDYDQASVMLNGNSFDLHPPAEEIASDAAGFIRYISSLENVFCGNIRTTQENFWRFSNWYFSSPFSAMLRYVAYVENYGFTNFPVVGIMYGESNGGKSTLTRLLAKMMCGENVELLPSSYFTRKKMEDTRANSKGLPIHIDDLAKAQWSAHYEGIIKNDYYGIHTEPVLLNYPAICISTNNVPALKPEISKRVVTCHVSARIDRETGTKMAKKVNDIQAKMGNALFREYMQRMFPLVSGMVEHMRTGDEGYFPDLLAISSSVLRDIFLEHSEIPPWMTEVGFDDYFGDKTVAQNAVAKVRNAWISEPRSFTCDETADKLIWTYPDGGPIYELRYVRDELPVQLNADVSGRSLIMSLGAARKLFGLQFTIPWYKKLFGN